MILIHKYQLDYLMHLLVDSAGIGRTGTLIALDILLDQAATENEVGVFDCVEMLRHERMNMVQTAVRFFR